MESLFIQFQMIYKSQFWKIDPYDWFCGPGSHMWTRQNNRSEIAWTRWSRIDLKQTLEQFGCSEKAIRSNGLTNQDISKCRMGNYVSSVKSISFVVLLIPQNEPVMSVGEHVFAIQNQSSLFQFYNTILLLFFVVGAF